MRLSSSSLVLALVGALSCASAPLKDEPEAAPVLDCSAAPGPLRAAPAGYPSHTPPWLAEEQASRAAELGALQPPAPLLAHEELLAAWSRTTMIQLQPCPPGWTGGSCNSLVAFVRENVHLEDHVVVVRRDDALEVRFAAGVNSHLPSCLPQLLDLITGEPIVGEAILFVPLVEADHHVSQLAGASTQSVTQRSGARTHSSPSGGGARQASK
jgi:hypothetical protein